MSMAEMTQEELVQEVLDRVLQSSTGVEALETVPTLSGVKSLPGEKDGKMVNVPLELIGKPASDAAARAEAAAKKKLDLSKVEYFTIDEGLRVQCMHLGNYDTEPATLNAMEQFAAERHYKIDCTSARLHHEIYLSDPRRTAPEKCKTVIREPVCKVE